MVWLNRVWRLLGSLKFTATVMAALIIALVLHALDLLKSETLRVSLLALLCLNIFACRPIAWRRFPAKPATVLFHLIIILVLTIAVLDRLTYYKALVVVAEGQSVRLHSVASSHGPWAPSWIDRLAILSERFETRYWRGNYTAATQADIVLFSDQSEVLSGTIEPNQPAVYQKLQIVATPTRGLAALLGYSDGRSPPQKGFLLFPEYKSQPTGQESELIIPGHAPLQCRLDMPSLIREDEPWELTPHHSARVLIGGRNGAQAQSLRVGEAMELDGGRLELLALRRYGTFLVHYDPFAPWLLGLALLAPAALMGHYWRRGKTT